MHLGIVEDTHGYYARIADRCRELGGGVRRRGAERIADMLDRDSRSVDRGIAGRWGLHDPTLVPRIAAVLGVSVDWLLRGGYSQRDMPASGTMVAALMSGHGQQVLTLLEADPVGVRLLDPAGDEEIWAPYTSIRHLTPLPTETAPHSMRSSESGRQIYARLQGIVTRASVHHIAERMAQPGVQGLLIDLTQVESITRHAVASLAATATRARIGGQHWYLRGAEHHVRDQIIAAGGAYLLES